MEAPSLRIALIGYGKMGKEVERVLLERGHSLNVIIDSVNDWKAKSDSLSSCDVAIEFSMPEVAVDNLKRCFECGLPVVTGTTGWHHRQEEIFSLCKEMNASLFHAANFSLGVNVFFEVNSLLAKLMNPYGEYDVSIVEEHHVAKLDAPSGTALVLANEIIRILDRKAAWTETARPGGKELQVKSVRTENVPGTHIVTYESVMDILEIKHTAKNRRGFALGAVLAAEWLIGKKGIFEMKDLLGLKK